MTRKNTPVILIKYLLSEFILSLIIFLLIFFSLVLLSNYIEELIFFREKTLSKNFFLTTFFLALMKSPSILINMSPFIFLFSGIFYFLKLKKKNEITPINLSGLSNKFTCLVPSIFSFFIGLLIILIMTPVSSGLTKYYESFKRKYSNNENLIIMSNTGLWIKEEKANSIFILRSDTIKDENFKNLQNVTIYKFNKNNDFIKRYDSSFVNIQNNKWFFNSSNEIFPDGKNNKNISFVYDTKISFNNLKNYFYNPNTFSFWNIIDEIENIKKRGYFNQELVITFNKYLLLPLMLFSMIVISSIFTLKSFIYSNSFIYIFIGIVIGISIHFLSDLSIALGKSGKIPLILSVWMPLIIIMILSIYSLIIDDN